MNDNVIPIKKPDRFGVYRASVMDSGEIVEKEQLGIAFFKPGSRLFRLKLWMFPSEQFFIAAQENDPSKYSVLALDEYKTSSNETRTHWNKIGFGELQGCFIRLKLSLLNQEVFVSLFPQKAEEKELDEAV